jgi:TRAP-type mannitol/chloroaromatic compound transport system substrate-binding protein
MKANGNEFVRLSPAFIKAGEAAAAKWSDEQAADNAWFKRALDHRRQFQDDIKAHWSSFRSPIGAK